MTKTTLRKIWWSVTFFYIALIYATLGIIPGIWDKLDAFLSGKVVLMQYIIYSVIASLIFTYMLFFKKEKSSLRYLLFFLFIGITITAVKLAKFPAEKAHLAEYGLLGVMVYNALKIDFDRFDKKLYINGALFCVVIGALDEVIQLFLPNRYFGWGDIFMNGLGGTITLLIIKFNILKKGGLPKSFS